MNYWVLKSEPEAYSWETLAREKKTPWNGVRNYQARNNLKKMKSGDRVLFYHSGVGKEIVGVAEVVKESYPDPTAKEPGWVVVDLKPVEKLKNPVTLQTIKKEIKLKDMILVRHGRLSVLPLSAFEFNRIVKMGGS